MKCKEKKHKTNMFLRKCAIKKAAGENRLLVFAVLEAISGKTE